MFSSKAFLSERTNFKEVINLVVVLNQLFNGKLSSLRKFERSYHEKTISTLMFKKMYIKERPHKPIAYNANVVHKYK